MKQLFIRISFFLTISSLYSFQPTNKAELQTAVDLWVSDETSAIATYGEINTWDVSLITDMASMFQNATSFNGDLSSWDFSEDFSYHNIYRNDLNSFDPAMVFTTTDSFYVDQESTQGSYEYWITAVDNAGNESDASDIVAVVLSASEQATVPTIFALEQNYPNPFNPSTQIRYALPEASGVVITVYDMMGRKVRTLVQDTQSAGYHTALWNATNDLGQPVSAGMCIYTIQAGEFRQTKKMVLLK